MDALPLIAGAGIALFLFNKKSSSSSSKDTNSSNSGSNSTGSTGIINTGDIIPDVKPINVPCSELQYRDKNGNCITFWVDGKTDDAVRNEIDAVSNLLYHGASWDTLCLDEQKDFQFIANPQALKITKQVIFNLWRKAPFNIKVNQLPATEKSPEFIKAIWKKVTAIYFDRICGLKQ